MGFIDSFKLMLRGNKQKKENEKTVDVPTTIDNLKVGGTIHFPLLFQPAGITEFSEQHLQISGQHILEFDGRENEKWGILNSGKLFVKKRGFEIEIIKSIKDTDDFIDAIEFDSFSKLMELEKHEIKNENGKEYIDSDDSIIKVVSPTSLLTVGEYLVQRDELRAKSNVHSSSDFRYIEAKKTDGSGFIYIFVMLDGESFVFESIVLDSHGFDFI